MTHLEYLRLLHQAHELRVAAQERVSEGVYLTASAFVHAAEARPLAAVRDGAAGLLNLSAGILGEQVGSWVQQALDRAAEQGAR